MLPVSALPIDGTRIQYLFNRQREPRSREIARGAESHGVDFVLADGFLSKGPSPKVLIRLAAAWFEAAPTSADGDLEDVQLAVRGAPIARDADWLPAIEQFGEGLFIHFDEAVIANWLAQPSIQARHKRLMAGYRQWAPRFAGNPPIRRATAARSQGPRVGARVVPQARYSYSPSISLPV
jgi:hypothetical protein